MSVVHLSEEVAIDFIRDKQKYEIKSIGSDFTFWTGYFDDVTDKDIMMAIIAYMPEDFDLKIERIAIYKITNNKTKNNGEK